MIRRLGVLVAVFPILLAAQAAVEHALGSARAATAAAPAKKVGTAISATFGKLDQALQDAAKPKPARSQQVSPVPSRPGNSTAGVPHIASVAEPPPPSVSYEDPAGIKKGMDYAEVMRRFGPPAMKLTTDSGMETLCYSGKDQGLDVQIRNGKVMDLRKTGASDQTIVISFP